MKWSFLWRVELVSVDQINIMQLFLIRPPPRRVLLSVQEADPMSGDFRVQVYWGTH